MPLNTNDLFIVTDKIRYDLVSNPLGGDADWAGIINPYFTVDPALYQFNGSDYIQWDEIGFVITTQAEYDDLAAILYATPDATITTNFLDNLAILNAWLLVNVYPPANLVDTGLRTGLPISYNKIAVYALQHLRDRRDTGSNPDYDINVFYYEGSGFTQGNITPPRFPTVVDNGLELFNNITSFRAERVIHGNYPNCTGGSDPYTDSDVGYCNHRAVSLFNEIVPHLVPYQLTYSVSPEWAPQDDCGYTTFTYRVMDNRFLVKYTEYDEGIPLIERNSTLFTHLFNTNYVPTSGVLTPDDDGYFIGTGFRNVSNVAPAVRAPRSQIGFPVTSSPVYAGIIDGFDIVKITVPNHRISRGEPIELVDLGLYDGFYSTMPYGDENTIAIRSIDQGVVVPTGTSVLLLSDAGNWLAADPFNLTDFVTRFQDITLDAEGNSPLCSSSAPGTVPFNDLTNYLYKIYVDNNPGNWPDYIDVNLFTDAILLAIKEFGGQNNYLNDNWITLEEQLNVTKDYFGFTTGKVPASVIRREIFDLQTAVSNDDGQAELAIILNGDFKHTLSAGDFVFIEGTGGTVEFSTGYDGQFTVISVTEDTITINTPITVVTVTSGATIRLLSSFTFSGDLFNGVSLMLDTAFKALKNQDEIKTNNLGAIRDWASVAFFDNQQRLYESISALGDQIKEGFNAIDKKIREEVLLTENSLISILDKTNNGNIVNIPDLESGDVNTAPDLSLVTLPLPEGSIHRVVFDKIPRGTGSPDDLKNSIANKHWSLDIIGPFARLDQARVSVTDATVNLGDNYPPQVSGNLYVKNIPGIRNIDDNVFIVTNTTTDSLINSSLTADELNNIHINKTPNITLGEENKLLALSSYIPIPNIRNILNYDVTYEYKKALPTTIIYADSVNNSDIRFEFLLKALHQITGDPLDFNSYIEYAIFGEHNGRYTDLTAIFDGVFTYNYRPENGILSGKITIDASKVPADFFDNSPEFYSILYKKIDVVLYYEDSPIQIPIVTMPVFIYRLQKKINIDLAYKNTLAFDRILNDTDIEPTYTIVLGDNLNTVIGKAEISLVDLNSNSERLLSIGQYVKMLESDIGVSGKFNHSFGPIMAYKSQDKYVRFVAGEQKKILDAYKSGILRKGQMFDVDLEGQIDPWYVFNDIPNVAAVSNIFTYIMPAIGNSYRAIREFNGIEVVDKNDVNIKKLVPFLQTSGLFNHLNRFNNPHKDGLNESIKLTYE